MEETVSDEFEQVLAYHTTTKHHYGRFARGPGTLDWRTQPNPFRRYRGAELIELDRIEPGPDPLYEPATYEGHMAAAPLNRQSVSQLLFDSLAISAWKRAGDVSWALRVNPSSGNLHPTEGYLLCGPVAGLALRPMVSHYAPREHALEVRGIIATDLWAALTARLPEGTLLIGLTSVHWREAWKYGERAFRYCQLDVGHATAAVSFAAAGLGWCATLLDGLGSDQLSMLLGTNDPQGAEAEHPDCVLAVYAQGQRCAAGTLPEEHVAAFAGLQWLGRPNTLSSGHVDWSLIDEAAAATEKPPTGGLYSPGAPAASPMNPDRAPDPAASSNLSLRQIIRQRRSASAMDSRGSIERDAFYKILLKTLPRPGRFPFNTLPWEPRVHLALFVHRVRGLEPGLYALVRDPDRVDALRSAMRDEFPWERPRSCPPGLELYRLAAGDVQGAARTLSCQQAIASDGVFSLGMIAEFEDSLQRFGPWFYRRMFWECGLIGQVLYLEAEAAGMRGTGIGCFFDEPVHRLLGLETLRYQSLYHFTAGYPVPDNHLHQ